MPFTIFSKCMSKTRVKGGPEGPKLQKKGVGGHTTSSIRIVLGPLWVGVGGPYVRKQRCGMMSHHYIWYVNRKILLDTILTAPRGSLWIIKYSCLTY